MRFACAVLSLCALRVSPGRSRENPELPHRSSYSKPACASIQRRQPQGSPQPRTHQQRTRRPPVRPPFLRLQPLLPTNRIPARTITHAGGGTVDILPPPPPTAQSRRTQSPAPTGRPRKIRPHPRPRPRRPPRIPRSHHNLHHPLAPIWLDILRPLRRRSPGIFELDLPPPASRHQNQSCQACQFDRKSGQGDSARSIYRWDKTNSTTPNQSFLQMARMCTYDVSRWGSPVRSDWETPGTVTETAKSVSAKAKEITHTLRSDEENLKLSQFCRSQNY